MRSHSLKSRAVRRRAVGALVLSVGLHAAALLYFRTLSPRSAPALTVPQTAEVSVEIEYEAREAELVKMTTAPVEARSTHSLNPLHDQRRTGASPRQVAKSLPEVSNTSASPAVVSEAGSLAMRSREAEPANPTERPPAAAQNMAAAITRVASAMADEAADRSDRQSPQARIRRWAHDANAEANARAGDVPEVWRDVEHRIERTFHPPRKLVTTSSTAVALGRQLFSTGGARRSSVPADERPTETASRERNLAADVMAGQAAAGEPSAWTRAEIVVEVGPDGLLRSADVAVSSGRAAFDKLALDTVCAAVAERPILDGCRRSAPCTIHLRWAIEAALRVQPPGAMVPSDPRTGGADRGLTPTVLGFSFDEASAKIRPTIPFETEIRTRIKLISID